MEISTDGRIHPEDALAHASKILRDSLQIFINFEEEPIQQDDSVSEEEERKIGDPGLLQLKQVYA